jgi:hypothetical protein
MNYNVGPLIIIDNKYANNFRLRDISIGTFFQFTAGNGPSHPTSEKSKVFVKIDYDPFRWDCGDSSVMSIYDGTVFVAKQLDFVIPLILKSAHFKQSS